MGGRGSAKIRGGKGARLAASGFGPETHPSGENPRFVGRSWERFSNGGMTKINNGLEWIRRKKPVEPVPKHMLNGPIHRCSFGGRSCGGFAGVEREPKTERATCSE